MPIETAVKDRVQGAWRRRVLIAGQDMIELVRIFLPQMVQRQPGEARGGCSVETSHGITR